MHDLRSFLQLAGPALWRIPTAVDPRYELTALQHQLDESGRFPILLASNISTLRGERSPIPVVTNLTASRELTARALGIPDSRSVASWFARRSAEAIAPRVLAREQAPVQQVVWRGDDASLLRLPVLTQHETEPGPYLTAAHATTVDLDTGTDNTAIQRCWVQSARRMSWFPYPASHNRRNLRKFWERGEPCPVAFWIGHHPAVLLGSQSKLHYPQSHWSATGGVLGEALRVVPSVLHGERIMVPADAEIVIEGFAPPNVMANDGPFGEYTGYLGAQVQAPVVEVSCITMRHDAIYHDYASGLTDMLVPDNLAMEGKLFQLVKAVAPSLLNVHVPTEGRRFHAYLQLRNPGSSEVRDALTAALAYRRVKTVIAVDESTDIFSPQAMLWALGTRVQWSRDSLIIDGLSGSSLDPSLPPGVSNASKMGVDATLATLRAAGQLVPIATSPREARALAAKMLAGLAGAQSSEHWPRF